MHNPNDPPINVSAGLNTSDEMFLIYFHFMLYQSGDELINVDSVNTIFLNQSEFETADATKFSAYPVPFSHEVNITYTLPQSAYVSIYIYDMQGRVIKKVVRENQSAGAQNETWNGTNEAGDLVPSGLYFYSAMIDGENVTGKLILNR
jgi:flagellar hook assembly protein FlgD